MPVATVTRLVGTAVVAGGWADRLESGELVGLVVPVVLVDFGLDEVVGLGEEVVGVTSDGADTPSSSPEAPEHAEASSAAAMAASGAVRMPHCALWGGGRPGGRGQPDSVRA